MLGFFSPGPENLGAYVASEVHCLAFFLEDEQLHNTTPSSLLATYGVHHKNKTTKRQPSHLETKQVVHTPDDVERRIVRNRMPRRACLRMKFHQVCDPKKSSDHMHTCDAEEFTFTLD